MTEQRKILTMENLPLGMTSSELRDMLKPLGQVSWAYVKAPEDGRLNQTAYLEMSTEKEASKVIVKWNGAELKQRVLRVKYVPPDFDLSKMSDSWRQSRPPKKISTSAVKELIENEPTSENSTEEITENSFTTASKTKAYTMNDLIELKPKIALSSKYDRDDQDYSSNPPLTLEKSVENSKENQLFNSSNSFFWFMVIFSILAITGLSFIIYFFWRKL
ncbi:MAG: RNA-binding protein [Blastocatellia bacterium]